MDWYADIVATIALGLSGRAFLQERKAKLEPQLDLEPLPAAHQMALRITSLGPLDYRTVRLRVVQPPENLRPPIEAVMFEHVWGKEVDLGPLRRGEVAEVLLRREEDAPEGTARLVFTCRSRWRTWQVLRSVRLEGPPPKFHVAVV
jgi:hypothetical protein